MLSVLRNSAFRRLWSAGVLSTAGSEISRLAVMLYLVRDQQSGAAIALWIALRALPGIVAAPWIGVLVDRCSQRLLLIAADVVRALVLLVLAAHPQAWLVFAAALVESVATAVFEPARRAALPRLVSDNELERANGLSQTSNTVVMIVCPVIGTHLFLTWGLAAALVVDAISFVWSAALITRIALPAMPQALERVSWNWAEIAASWQTVAADARIRVVVAVQFVSLLCTGLWAPLAPFFIRDVLQAGEAQLGWQFSAFGVGGALGAVIAPRLAERWPSGRLFIAAVFVEGVHMAVYSIAGHWLLSLACIFSWGIAVSVIAVSSASYIQRTMDGAVLGRVFTLIRQSEQVGMLAAMALAAALSGAASPQIVFALGGVLYAATTLYAAVTRGGRELWRQPPPATRWREQPVAAAGAPTFAEPVE